MTVPQINIDTVSEGVFGVMTAMTVVQQTMGNTRLAFFLDIVPERGEKLWERFRSFQKQRAGSSFVDFVKNAVTADPVKLFYPKECILDQMTRAVLVPEIQKALRGKIQSDEDVLKIHFSEGTPYEIVRGVACKGCHMTKCPHWISHTRRK